MTPEEFERSERRKLVWGFVLLTALVVAGMALLSWYLTNHGSHLG